MKRIKSLLLTSIFSLMVLLLTGCGLIKEIGNLGENGGEESLEYSVEETQGKLQTLSSTNGLEITMKSYSKTSDDGEEESYTTFGIKDNTYWIIETDGYGMAFKVDAESNKAYKYTLYDDAWIFDGSLDVSDDELAAFESYFGLSTWLYFGHVYDGRLKSSGTERVAGRECNVYKHSLNLIVEKFEYTIAIDKETGATMKFSMGGRIAGDSGEFTFEVTEFKTSGITTPTLPAPSYEEE